MKRIAVGLSIVALALLTGCASTATPTDETDETPDAVEESIDNTAACEQLFLGDEHFDAAFTVVTDYAASPTSVDPATVEDAIVGLESVRSDADAELADALDAQLEPLETMRARLAGENPSEAVDFDGYRDGAEATLDLCEATIG